MKLVFFFFLNEASTKKALIPTNSVSHLLDLVFSQAQCKWCSSEELLQAELHYMLDAVGVFPSETCQDLYLCSVSQRLHDSLYL